MPLSPTRAAVAPETHVLVYDAECPFCTATARWLQRHARAPVTIVPFQCVDTSKLLTRLTEDEVESVAHFVTPRGIEYHGGQAMSRAFRLLRFGWPAGVLDLPVLSLLRDVGYALIARMRPLLSRWIYPRE